MAVRVLLFGPDSAGRQALALQLRARAFVVVAQGETRPDLILLYGGPNAAATLADFQQAGLAGFAPTLAVLSDPALMGSAAMSAAGVTDFLASPVSESALHHRLSELLREQEELGDLLASWPDDLPPPDPKSLALDAPSIALDLSDQLLRERCERALHGIEMGQDADVLVQDMARAMAGSAHLCTLILSNRALSPLERERLMAAGRFRLLEAPFSDLYLRQRVLAAAAHQAKCRQMQAALDQIQSSTSRDAVTGLRTRALAQPLIQLHMDRKRRERGGALALIDLDDLKLINDRLGHGAGDQALRHIAETLMEAFIGSEILSRWGGDEMLVFDPSGQELESTLQVCQRQVAQFTVGQGDRRARQIGFSFGVAQVGEVASLEALLELADQRLYAQKIKKKEARKASPKSP